MKLRQAILTGDISFIAGWISGRMMIDVPPDVLTRWAERKSKELLDFIAAWEAETEEFKQSHPFELEYPGDGTIDLWLRARMTEEGYYKAGREGAMDIHLSVTLHTGFLYIHETAEQLQNLRRSGEEKVPSGPATPGIERTQRVLTGIDVTARRVVPTEETKSLQC